MPLLSLLFLVLIMSPVTKSVEAKYSIPIMTSEPAEIEDGGAAHLYCRASGGYPAGTIHWFDQRNTNWTKNAELQITQGHDGLFTLSSKLSFRTIDTTWGPFRCIVVNYRSEEEGASTTSLGREDLRPDVSNDRRRLSKPVSDRNMVEGPHYCITIIVTSGSLTAVLLIVFFSFKQRLDQQLKKAESMDLSRLNFATEPAVIRGERPE